MSVVQVSGGYTTTEERVDKVAKFYYQKRHSVSMQQTLADFEAYEKGKMHPELRRVRDAVLMARTMIGAFLNPEPAPLMANDGWQDETHKD